MMEKVVDVKIDSYKDGGNNCSFTALGTYLATIGISKKEIDDIFGYTMRCFLETSGDDVWICDNSMVRTIEFLQNNLDVHVNFTSEENYEIAWDQLQNRIDNNEMGIACVSIYYLPFHQKYKKEHYPHFLFVMGYNTETESVLVEDTFFNYRGYIDFEDFLNGHNIMFFERRNTLMEITHSHKLKEVNVELIKELFIKNKKAIKSLDYENICSGLKAISKFQEWLIENLNSINENLWTKLVFHVEGIYQESQRHLLFLRNCNSCEALLDCVSSLSKQWQALMNLLKKMSIKKDSVSLRSMNDVFKKITDLIEQYADIKAF